MKTKTIMSWAIIASVFSIISFAQEKKDSFDVDNAMNYIRMLSADAMQGRKSGEPGGRMAADYIVEKLKEWGIEPAGNNGSYFQEMPFEYYWAERGASLEIITGKTKREYVYGEDWAQYQYSGSGCLAADVVFVGYGISAPEKGYDEYSGLDVKGKMALFSKDIPRKLEEGIEDECRLQRRIKTAQEHGACGVLIFQYSELGYMDSRGLTPARTALTKEIYKQDFIILALDNRVVDFMFKHLKTEIPYLMTEIERTSKSQSFDTGVRSVVNMKIVYDEKRATQNILAKISGTDKNLKEEYVILGAHYDHLGVDMAGDVLNGADDNASGTAVVMETARIMKSGRIKPKRTVIFALWAAEELRVLGSKYYTENPVYPLEKTALYINLDMEGEGNEKILFRGTYYAPEIWTFLSKRLPKKIMSNVIPKRGGPSGSDHNYFHYNGVPSYFIVPDGYHFKTNRVGDVFELIQPDVLKNAGDLVYEVVKAFSLEPFIPVMRKRKENFFWKYETIINYEPICLNEAIETHKDAINPDVDLQLTLIGGKEGLIGDAQSIAMLKSLVDSNKKIRECPGLEL